MKHPLERLTKLALKSDTLAEFIAEALRWPRRYGFPGTGTKKDYEQFYKLIKGDL